MNKKYLKKGITLTIMFFVFTLLHAQEWNELTKITASDGLDLDKFGISVSVSGDYAVIGACWDDDVDTDCGSAYIFKKEGSNWSQQAKLLASDASAQSQFGNSVSISGDYVVIGAYTSSDNGLYSGSAYIFKRDGTNWNQEAKLLPSDGVTYDYFGSSVSVSGDYVVIGTPFDDDNGESSGSAYIFKRDGTNWNREAKLSASDGATDDEFGFTVAVSGDYVVAGAPLDGGTVGSAYIYKREGTSWPQQAKLEASDAVTDIYFGNSVSVSGDYAIIGAYQGNGNVDNSGAAYIFKREDTNWLQQSKIFTADGAFDDYFGFSVSIYGDYAIVGAKNDYNDGTKTGSAYIFKLEESDWIEQEKLLPAGVGYLDAFGNAVSIFGNDAIVGARGDDDYGMNSGAAYMYELQNSSRIDNSFASQNNVSTVNYPNPFNTETTISYSIPASNIVIIEIYDIQGKKIKTLVNEYQVPGNYSVKWNGKDEREQSVNSGVYFYRISAGKFFSVKEMIFIKQN